jgi:hypothetical protein
LQHPQIAYRSAGETDLQISCIDCHPDYNVYPYDPYDYYFGANYYWDHPRYAYYYGYPCWWDEYYWDYYNSAGEEEFWYDNIAYGDYGYYNYYQYEDDPYEEDEPEILESVAPDYHGPIPRRTPSDELPPPDKPAAERESKPERRASDQADTTGVREAPRLRAAPNTKRAVGQPPYSRPTGWWGAKPPELRKLAVEEKLKPKGGTASKPKKSSNNKSSSSSSSSSDNDDDDDDDDDKKEEKKEEKSAPPERRGRPKRGPP